MKSSDGKRTVVIIAEDDPDDRLLIQDALKEASSQPVEVFFVEDGAKMLDFLYHRGEYGEIKTPQPELVLLDINMPKKSGLEVLEEIKRDPALRTIPVVVLTTSHAPEHVVRSYELGGNGYITKPNTYTQLVELLKNLERYWFDTVKLP